MNKALFTCVSKYSFRCHSHTVRKYHCSIDTPSLTLSSSGMYSLFPEDSKMMTTLCLSR